MSPYVRTVLTGSGARAVQVVWSQRAGHRDIEQIGSARDERELALFKAIAAQRIEAGQGVLELGFVDAPLVLPVLGEADFRIVRSGSDRLVGVLQDAWQSLGFDRAVPDRVFEQLVFARLVEPTSKFDSIRVLKGLGLQPASYSTIRRRLAKCVALGWREQVEEVCREHVDASELLYCLYDVTTLHWETHEGDGFRESGFSKNRRLEPQVVVGLLTTRDGWPLMVNEFPGNRAEVKTMMPVLERFAAASKACGITVVADAGMVSEDNMRALQDAGFSFIVGQRIPSEPWVVSQWRQHHPNLEIPDGQVFCTPVQIGTKSKPRRAVVYWQYRATRARRDLAGVDKTLAKARLTVAGKVPAARNRFVTIDGGKPIVNQELVTSAKARAGLRAYITDLPYQGQPIPDPGSGPPSSQALSLENKRLLDQASRVISAYHELWHVEKAFRMSKHDLKARPAFVWTETAIHAHLTIVFTALAIGSYLEQQSGVSLRKLINTLRPIRRVTIQTGKHTFTAEDNLTTTATQILTNLNQPPNTH